MMVTLGIAGIAVLLFATMFSNVSAQAISAAELVNLTSFNAGFTNILARSTFCNATLGLPAIVLTPATTTVTYALPFMVTDNVGNTQNLLAPNNMVPNSSRVQVASIQLKISSHVGAANPTIYTGKLWVNYQLLNATSGMAPPKPYVSGLIMMSTNAAGNITSCPIASSPVLSTFKEPAWCTTPLPAGCSSNGGTWTWVMIYAAFAPSDIETEIGSGALDGTRPWDLVSSPPTCIYCGIQCYNGFAWCNLN